MFGKKCVVFFVLLVVLETALKIEAAGSVAVSNNKLTLQGNAHIQFLEPQERVWAGLSNGRRFPVIHSGDRIALRVLYSSYSTRWIRCYSSYCYYSTCPGDKIMSSSKWSSCTYEQFYVRAVNKNDGQTILSGDYVTLAPYRRGSTCRLRCFSSSSTKCNSATCVGENYFKGNNAFAYSYLTFQIFSRNGIDGQDPVQYGDTVAFRYPFYHPNYWLYFSGSYLYARSCSSNSKTSCAYKYNLFGFQIFKPL